MVWRIFLVLLVRAWDGAFGGILHGEIVPEAGGEDDVGYMPRRTSDTPLLCCSPSFRYLPPLEFAHVTGGFAASLMVGVLPAGGYFMLLFLTFSQSGVFLRHLWDTPDDHVGRRGRLALTLLIPCGSVLGWLWPAGMHPTYDDPRTLWSYFVLALGAIV